MVIYVRTRRLVVFFFGNLGYAPNSKAVDSILVAHKSFRKALRSSKEYRDLPLTITIAGRQIGLYKRLRCLHEGLRVVSPVGDMMTLVKEHDVAILPIFTGSGMQSKLLESICWGVPVAASCRIASTIGLVDGEEFIEIKSDQDIKRVLELVLRDTYRLGSIADKALKKIGSLSWKATAEILEQIYMNKNSGLIDQVESRHP